ncbi:SAM-dependent methyltransferase [Fimbriimonas ginsengisoli]|uniref:NoeA host specific nodulation protein n=1 Tax=Fimbriimonas ginsengisoli Gsoil 348 TaxID=661478 RepID=A0A068NKH0_FIMGI|nr:SAM-dependent methyltransferase [Fimbriimonas ginsengisoli]AIE83986.1 NoeA host specific nodulation protein [Fimbriimonas ginsengisoli Gsoil 348]
MPRTRLSSSFRDPSGFVFREGDTLLRAVSPSYLPHLGHLTNSGLYADLVKANLLIPHEELVTSTSEAGVLLKPEPVKFISYPYEWSFGQLKDAALTTLEIQRRALGFGMWLKDASAYNIQRHGGRSLLIDTLSFELYEEGAPWPAYRQFCEHFLAPLALMGLVDIRLGRLQREYIDGIPLDLASRLVPAMTKLNVGLAIHLHAHARAQVAHAGAGTNTNSGRVAKNGLLAIVDSLRTTVERLDWKPKGTPWADYYSDTNYGEEAFAEKRRLVSQMLESIEPKPESVWDLGANTGEFSLLATDRGIDTVSWDIDPGAVERNYRKNRSNDRLYPLLQDLTNPSPGLGWGNRERDGLAGRSPAGAIMALALVHHLAIGNNVPLSEVAGYFAELAPWAIVEFVPKSDSQVQRLLSTRKDIYADYSAAGFEEAFCEPFDIVKRAPISGSDRTLYLLKRRTD